MEAVTGSGGIVFKCQVQRSAEICTGCKSSSELCATDECERATKAGRFSGWMLREGKQWRPVHSIGQVLGLGMQGLRMGVSQRLVVRCNDRRPDLEGSIVNVMVMLDRP